MVPRRLMSKFQNMNLFLKHLFNLAAAISVLQSHSANAERQKNSQHYQHVLLLPSPLSSSFSSLIHTHRHTPTHAHADTKLQTHSYTSAAAVVASLGLTLVPSVCLLALIRTLRPFLIFYKNFTVFPILNYVLKDSVFVWVREIWSTKLIFVFHVDMFQLYSRGVNNTVYDGWLPF